MNADKETDRASQHHQLLQPDSPGAGTKTDPWMSAELQEEIDGFK